MVVALLAGGAEHALAVTKTSTGSANWGTGGTWSPAGVPTAADDVIIAAGHTVTMNGNAGAALSLTINGTAHWQQARTTNVGAGGVTLNVGGDITGTVAGVLTSTGGLTINATTTSNTVIVTRQTTAGQTIGGTGSLANLQINATSTNTGTLTVRTALTGTSTLTNTGTLNIGGTSTITGLTANTAANTVNYSGVAQTVKLPTASTYSTLNLSGSGAKTLPGALTISGDFAMSGTASTTAVGTLGIAGGFTLGAGTSFTAGAFTHTVGGNFSNSAATFTATGSTFSLNGAAAQAISGSAVSSFANLMIANTSAAVSASTNFNVSGTLNMNGTATVLAPAAAVVVNSAAAAGTISGSGTVQVTRTAAIADYSSQYQFTTNTLTNLTVEYIGAAAQTVSAITYGNLRINNASGAALAAGATTVGGTMTLTSGTLVVAGNTLNLNGPNTVVTSGSLSTTSSSNLSFGGTSTGVSVPSSVTQLNNLSIDNANGITLSGSPTVNGTLTFTLTSGNLNTTTANTLTLAAAGSISGAATSKHVVGNLARAFAVAGAFTYAVGDGTNYTPLAITFTTLSAPGNLTVTTPTPAGDHPDTTSVTSSVDPGKSVNRYWTLKDATLSGNYNATFNYIGGTPVDLDSGVTASNFVIARGTSCTGSGGSRTCPTNWGRLNLGGAPTSTQATATGISISSGAPQSDFVVGESLARFAREKELIYTRELY